MRNRGKRSYLKPVHPDILLIELMYQVFSYVAWPVCIVTANKVNELSKISPNFRDILAVLLTSKNWRNLFKNYVIITAKNLFTGNYIGYKTSVNMFSNLLKISECKNYDWYKYIKTSDYDPIVLNKQIVGRYGFSLSINHGVRYELCFYINCPIMIKIYHDGYVTLYYPINKTEFKYILQAEDINVKKIIKVIDTVEDADIEPLDLIYKLHNIFP